MGISGNPEIVVIRTCKEDGSLSNVTLAAAVDELMSAYDWTRTQLIQELKAGAELQTSFAWYKIKQ